MISVARNLVFIGGAIRSRTGLTGFAILSIDSQDQILTADSSPQLPQETPPQAIDLYGLGAWVAEMKKRPQHRSTRGELARGSQGDNNGNSGQPARDETDGQQDDAAPVGVQAFVSNVRHGSDKGEGSEQQPHRATSVKSPIRTACRGRAL